MTSVDEARRSTQDALADAFGLEGDVDLAYITQDTLGSLEAAEEPSSEVLNEHGASVPPPPEQALGFQLIYGHALVVIGTAYYFKLVQSGTWTCLNSPYYRWTNVSLKRWVGTCAAGDGKWQLGRWT